MSTVKPKECYKSLLAQKLMVELKKRNMEAFYCETKEDALKKVLEMIPKDSLVSWGGSATLHEIGLQDAFKNEFEEAQLALKVAINTTKEAQEEAEKVSKRNVELELNAHSHNLLIEKLMVENEIFKKMTLTHFDRHEELVLY